MRVFILSPPHFYPLMWLFWPPGSPLLFSGILFSYSRSVLLNLKINHLPSSHYLSFWRERQVEGETRKFWWKILFNIAKHCGVKQVWITYARRYVYKPYFIPFLLPYRVGIFSFYTGGNLSSERLKNFSQKPVSRNNEIWIRDLSGARAPNPFPKIVESLEILTGLVGIRICCCRCCFLRDSLTGTSNLNCVPHEYRRCFRGVTPRLTLSTEDGSLVFISSCLWEVNGFWKRTLARGRVPGILSLGFGATKCISHFIHFCVCATMIPKCSQVETSLWSSWHSMGKKTLRESKCLDFYLSSPNRERGWAYSPPMSLGTFVWKKLSLEHLLRGRVSGRTIFTTSNETHKWSSSKRTNFIGGWRSQ